MVGAPKLTGYSDGFYQESNAFVMVAQMQHWKNSRNSGLIAAGITFD
jgi:hypothetical protein